MTPASRALLAALTTLSCILPAGAASPHTTEAPAGDGPLHEQVLA